MFKRKIKDMSLEARYGRLKKRFHRLAAFTVLLVLGVSCYLYLNFDYLVFKHLITQHYIYTDTLDEVFEEELKRDINGHYYQYFDNLVLSVLTRYIREKNNDRYTYQYLPEQYERSKELDKEEAEDSTITELTEDIVYVLIPNFSKYTKDFLYDHMDSLKQYPNIILDLQNNPGGDIFAQYDMIDLFVPKGETIAIDVTRSKLFSRVVHSKREQILPYENIVILQNQKSASSSEGFIAALRDNLENVTLIGTTTFGKGIGQVTLPLRRGFAVKATTMLWNTPKNQNIQHQGIPADIPYEGEDIIGFAVSYIQKQ